MFSTTLRGFHEKAAFKNSRLVFQDDLELQVTGQETQQVLYWLLELSTHCLLQPMGIVELGHMITGVTGLWTNWI